MADTIYAPSSGQARAAISIIRISGPGTFAAIEALTGMKCPAPRRIVVRRILDDAGDMIDEAMVVVFPGPASFTGEDMAEVQCHGGRAVVTDICDRLETVDRIRLAKPGEFTRRAFLNGKLSLSEAEGLADLISAETAAQRRQAARLMSGGLGRSVDRWRTDLINAAAMLEVTIDWADEDVPEDVTPDVQHLLSGVREDFVVEQRRSERAQKLRTGFQVALVGAPNAGKSTLLNALAGRDAAIVSDRPGTTRDIVEVAYDLNGLPVRFLDMAGIRNTADHVEQIGVARARTHAADADLRVLVSAADAALPDAVSELRQDGDITIWAKADIADGAADISISCVDGTGLEDLLDLIYERLQSHSADAGLLSHMRHRNALDNAKESLERALQGLEQSSPEIVAVEIRDALQALEQLIGRVGVEDVLDTVFSQFCLGK